MQLYICDTLPIRPRPRLGQSFTGFITEVAEANRLKSQEGVWKLIFPTWNSTSLRSQSDYVPVTFDLMPEIATVSEQELLRLTFHHFGQKFGRYSQPPWLLAGFLSDYVADNLRVCPYCLEQDRYIRLIWRFKDILGCPKHRVKLISHCQICSTSLRFTPLSLKVAICSKCSFDVATSDVESLSASELRTSRFWHEQFSYFLEPASWEEDLADVHQNIGTYFAYRRQLAGFRRNELVEQLGINSAWLYSIERGETWNGLRVPLYAFLSLCEAVGLSLRELFEEGAFFSLEETRIQIKSEAELQEERILDDAKQVIQKLNQRGDLWAWPDLEQSGWTKGTLRRYPRVRAYIEDQIETLKNQHAQKVVEAALQAMYALIDKGIRPTQTRLGEEIGLSGAALRKRARRGNDDMRELLDEAKEHVKRMVNNDYQERASHLQNEVIRAVNDLNRNGVLYTGKDIARHLGVSYQYLCYYDEVKAQLDIVIEVLEHGQFPDPNDLCV